MKHNKYSTRVILSATAILIAFSFASTFAQEPVDIWAAAAAGDLDAVNQQLASGVDVDVQAPGTQWTPLMAAALAGQAEVAERLLEAGADPDLQNNDGNTALLMAAFFGHIEIVESLIAAEADLGAVNNKSETPFDVVKGEWDDGLERLYLGIGQALGMQIDIEKVKAARPKIAALLKEQGGEVVEEETPATSGTGFIGSYFKNGEIHVNEYGTPEGEPLTSGHQDFKPSWSKTGDMLVFFRRLKNDPVVTNWITQMCIINVDGTGFHAITDGTQTNFNQTWSRDGTNTPIWNRKNPERGSFIVMQSAVGAEPGEEIELTDRRYHNWAYSCLIDGRILVQCAHPDLGWGYYLMTPNPGGQPSYERLDCELATRGILDRISISPSEDKVCFEYQLGYQYEKDGRTLYIADFDADELSITNPVPIANEEGANRWFAYPRWSKDETAIVYQASPSLHLYTLEDGSTQKVSMGDGDYRYPHMEATPK
jgi:hypothetical protein